MTTNSRNCNIFTFDIDSFKHTVQLKPSLCSPCDGENSTVDHEIDVFDFASSPIRVSIVGYGMVHVLMSDGRACNVLISAKRILRCQDCTEGCDPLEMSLDIGCIETGHVLATGDYELYVTPQINLSGEDIEGLKMYVIIEPIIDEHIYAGLFNK